jgi:uncharacterized membrane protein
LHAVHKVSGAVLWANMHLLFWLSLVPFVTHWMNDSHFAKVPVASYGAVLLMSGTAYYILSRLLIRLHGEQSALAGAIGGDAKGLISLALYTAAVALAFFDQRLSLVIYILVALIWLIPDRRIENALRG